MSHEDRMFSPPPSYPDSVAYDHEALYPSSSSDHTSSSGHSANDRRFSMSSGVLPLDHRRGSSGSSRMATSERGYHLEYDQTAGLITPPGSSMVQRPPSLESSASLNRQASVSYFSVSEPVDNSLSRTPNSRSSRAASHGSPVSPVSPLSLGSNRIVNLSPLVSTSGLSRPALRSLPDLPFTCTFQDTNPGCMVLMPPRDAANQTPLYYIEVRPNCFMPMSFITTVSRGSNRELVGRFEMGVSRDKPTLFMGSTLDPLDNVFRKFRKVNTKLRDRWLWERGQYKLHWDCRNEYEAVCYNEADSDKVPLAILIPAAAAVVNPLSSHSLPVTSLEVHTSHPSLLDEIIISALIVERKRQTPTDGTRNAELFN